MSKKYLLLVVYGVLHTLIGIAQGDKKIDSLLNDLKNPKDDTSKVNILNELSRQSLIIKNVDNAKIYAEDALVLAEKKAFKKGVTNSQSSLGNVYKFQGNTNYYQGAYPEALKNYLISLQIFEKTEVKRDIANLRRNIGLVYWVQGNFSEAIKNHLFSLNILKEIEDKNAIAIAYNDIGNAYENQGKYQEALKNYMFSLKIHEEMGNKEAMINRFFNIGFLYDDQDDYSEALKNFFSALRISEETGNIEGIAACHTNIGGIYYNMAKAQTDLKRREQLLDEAMNNYLISLKQNKKTGDKEGLAACYISIGEIFIELKKFSSAKQFLNNGLSLFKEVEATPEERYQMPAASIRDIYRLLLMVDSATGNWKEAFNNQKLYIFYRDSLINEKSLQKIIKVQMQYDFDKMQDSLKYLQTLSNEKLKQQTLLTHEQKILKNYLFAILILFAILSFFVYRNHRTRQKLKMQTLRIKIASDLHDDVGSTLSSISIFSQMAQQQSKEVIPMLETIGESSRKMLDAMADIVWTINPENDQFEKIILRMKNFAYELLGAKNIDFEFIADDHVTTLTVPMNVRKNLYLIFKEATNNLVKYSAADRALFSLTGEKNILTLLIKDNGKGFDVNLAKDGNGLKNMKKRAGEMGAELMIDSLPGNGTTIKLRVEV